MLVAVVGKYRPLAAPRGATLTASDRTGAPAAAGRTASLCGRIRRSCSSPTSFSPSGRRGHRSFRAPGGSAVPPPPGRERRWRAGGGREGKEKKEKMEEEEEKQLELEDIKTSDGDVVEVADPSLQLRSDLAT